MVTKQIKHKTEDGKEITLDLGALAKNVSEDTEHRFASDTEKNNWNEKLDSDGNGSDLTSVFTQATTRGNLVSEEKHSTLFGKIAKWFADLKSHAFQDLVQNATTAATDKAVSAAVAKALQDQITEQNTKITAKGGTLPTWYGLSWYPKRSLDTVDIVISGKTTVEMTAGSWITIGTLSGDALVPVGERFATLSTLDGIIGTMMISSSGTVSIYWAANVPAGKYIQTSVKYII